MQSYFEENERISPMIKLSEAEWKVMNLLWEEAPQTIMQITNHFKETTGWTKHTVMTFLRRMEEKKELQIEAIPGTLIEAVYELEKDELIQEVLGRHVSEKYIRAKKEEWAQYRSQVTDWEIGQYLNRF